MNTARETPAWVELVARNPYRVLGLPGDSTWSEIRARVDALRARAEPENETTPWDIPWFAPLARAAAEVERAATRLTDPVQRVRDRLFWFHERVSEMAVHELLPGNIRNALEGWSATSEPLARHDAAVVALLKALTLDSRVEDAAAWRRMFHEWSSAVTLEEYWMGVLRLEMGGGFDDPASLADIREVREAADRMIATPLLGIARAAVLAEDLPVAARALAVLREALPADVFSRTCGDLASHVWGRFDADWTTPTAVPAPLPPADSAAVSVPVPPPGRGPIQLDTQNPGLWDLGAEPERPARAKPPGDAPAPAGPTAAPDGPAAEAHAPEPSPEPGGIAGERSPETRLPVEPEGDRTAVRARAPEEPATGDEAPVGGELEPASAAGIVDPGSTAPRDPGEEDVREVDIREPVAPGASDAGRATEAGEAPRWGMAGRARTRLRPIWIGGIAASVAVAVALAALDPGRGSGEPEEPPDPVTLTVLENRLEQSYADVARAMVARHEIRHELDLVEQGVDGYRILVEDYERRASYRLPVDRDAWLRVARTRDRFETRRDSLRLEHERLLAVQDSLERVDASLLAAYNLLLRSVSRSRAPSPR